MTGGKQMTLSDLVTVLVAVAVTMIVIVCTLAGNADKREFMRECQDARNPHYVCTGMWRGSVTLFRTDLN